MLGVDCPENYDVLRVDGEVLSRFSVGEPRKLHDRATGRVEDDPLDVLDCRVDAVAVSGGEGQFRSRSHEVGGERWVDFGATVSMRADVCSPVRFSFRRRSESPSDAVTASAKKESDVPGGGGVKTARERAEEKRAEKLEQVREQVEDGSLVIRKMTADERRRYPPFAPQKKPADRR